MCPSKVMRAWDTRRFEKALPWVVDKDGGLNSIHLSELTASYQIIAVKEILDVVEGEGNGTRLSPLSLFLTQLLF